METPKQPVNQIESGGWGKIERELGVLSGIDSFSSKEDKLAGFLLDRAKEMGVEAKRDPKGNVWFLSDSAEGEILLATHMDKVGAGVPIKVVDKEVTGRLDDALGMSIVLSLFEEGLRPSAVFTVEEESEEEFVSEDGSVKMRPRKIKDGIYNAGARYAAEEIFEGKKQNPKLVVTVDVSKMGKRGGGPMVYTSSGSFRFPSEPLKDIKKILTEAGVSASFVGGPFNDSLEFTFEPLKGVVAIEVHVDNLHSSNEIADLQDVVMAQEAVRSIVAEHRRVSPAESLPPHAQPPKGPFNLTS